MKLQTLLNDDIGNLCVSSIIDGQPIVLSSSTSFPVVSAPAQNVLHYGQTASIEVATHAIESAAKAFKTYKSIPVFERRRLLLRAAEIFDKRAEEGMQRQMSETSCSEAWACTNAKYISAIIHEIAGAVSMVLVGDVQNSHSGKTSLVFKEPVGPVLLIPPWNAAISLCAQGIATALAAGCSVVVKASELSPWTHHFVAEVFHEAGFPPGSVNLIMADRPAAGPVTEAIIAHPALRQVEFIGSSQVGRIIAKMAATYLKPIWMELGDQSPAIVLDDANLQLAAALCARGAIMHHGQICFSTERIIVQSSVKDEFVELLKGAIQDIPSGESAVSNAHAGKAKAVIDDAVARGAKFLLGNSEMTGPASVHLSILTDVDEHSTISAEEAFAPTAFLVAVENEGAAIVEANSRSGGLAASVFTGSYERGLRIARELEFGMVKVNDMTVGAELGGPVTCVKGSGWGSSFGRYGIEKFLYNKSVTLMPS